MKLTAREKRVIGYRRLRRRRRADLLRDHSPAAEQREAVPEVDLKKRMLLKHRETLSREAIYKTRLEQLSGHLETYRARLLPGDNPNVAGAALQTILKNFADQSGVEITMKNILPEKKTQDSLTKVSVKIDTNCNLEQLVQFIATIENYEKFLKIDDCTISGFRVQRRFEIRPSLTIAGYISTREEKS